MRLTEILTERKVGVVFDRHRYTLIRVSRPNPWGKLLRFGLGMSLVALVALGGRYLGGGWVLPSILLGCAIMFGFAFLSPGVRTHYDSWQYPESYDMFDDETIRDRFFTHPEEFTHIEEK